MRSSLPSGKSSTPPARCIHRPQRDTSSAGYRLLVSRASVGASRELSSRRSPALAPHTCAVSPTFRYGAFLFVASALADLSSTRLTSRVHNRASIRRQFDSMRRQLGEPASRRRPPLVDDFAPNPTRKLAFNNISASDCSVTNQIITSVSGLMYATPFLSTSL